MSKKRILAITNCRVSSQEQLDNNSLTRQAKSVLSAAKELGAIIPNDGQWSGHVSSKRGKNLERKDIKGMLAYCKKFPLVKYLIVDEPDRFMRSIEEAFYLEMEFKKLGVKVWYASDNDLNKDDLTAKLMKFMKYFVAEGSNEERQNKSIAGHISALKEGRYTFVVKAGYRRGYQKGVQEIHPTRGPALQRVLKRIASNIVTPSEGLIELNKSKFCVKHKPIKMDKFRIIANDPFYAGIVEMNKQVKFRNENGLHEPLITKDEHLRLVEIMNNKKKNQSGPHKNGNPNYPLSNLLSCISCKDKKSGKFTGLDLNNGVNKQKIYEKYRCRSCNRYVNKSDIHNEIERLFNEVSLSSSQQKNFKATLSTIWRQKENQNEREINRLNYEIKTEKSKLQNHVNAVADPVNISIREELHTAIQETKELISKLEDDAAAINSRRIQDQEAFLEFAFKFLENMGSHFFEISKDNRLRCKELIFPSGFWIDEKNKVYTPEISPLITLGTIKKDANASKNAPMVRVRRL